MRIPTMLRRSASRSTSHGRTRAAVLTMVVAVVACDSDKSFVMEPPGSASFAGQANVDTPVTSTLADADASVASSLQIRSDGLGAYTNSRTLSSVIQGAAGAWVLDSRVRNATRRVFLDFGQPVAGSGPNGGDPVSVPSAAYFVRIISKCNQYNTSMWAVAPGATITCPLHFAFDYAGASYGLQMNPTAPNNPDGAPETQPVNITCVTPASGSGPCTGWRILPSGTVTAPDGSLQYRNVARLVKVVTSKGQTENVNQGDFSFSFSILVTNP